ncbi:hypothetical protein A1359_03795 [Methylomonas lenta]|uniref:Uncharacterized protein n=1 Tax=Methylomonas lenta TaxID=980561 RepID=A0A177NN95_9GAMM|nr:SIR2 family protein [Methylomonas lenta]OAI19425.1 hypothetical protein A1359_03795 [Methylomonas lenta]
MELSSFLRTYKTRAKNIHWFIGAGASANAGIMSAWEMTWEFKRNIYCSENGKSISSCKDLSNPRFRELIQSYLDSQQRHPNVDSLEEYSHYFSIAYRSESDRRAYIEEKISSAEIKFSHRVMAALIGLGVCKAIWTTNFDSVIEESWQSLGLPISKLHIASIGNAIKASQCIREDRFPLYVKLHGDFQSSNLKNTKSELLEQDRDFRNALIELVGSRFGFAFVGYSGRDDSIMSVFEEIISKANNDYPGLFWFNRTGAPVVPRVYELIETAQKKGIDAHVIDIPSFDELMLNLYKYLNDELMDFEDYLQPMLERRSPVSLEPSNQETDIIRFNAFKVLSVPQSVYLFDCDIGGVGEVKDRIAHCNKVLATRVSGGVLAFGDRDEIASVFSIKEKNSISVQPFKVKDYKTSEYFLLYQVIEKIFCSRLPLKSYQNKNGLTLYIDPDSKNLALFNPLINALKTKFENSPKINGKTPGLNRYWSESIQLRIEERMDALWLIVNPVVYIEQGERNWDDPRYVKQEDFRKKRLGSRYNKQADDIFSAWAVCLGLDHHHSNRSVTFKAFKEDIAVNPTIEFSTVSSFSNRG